MCNPFTVYLNKIQTDPAVTKQPNKINNHTILLNKINTTVSTWSRLHLDPLNNVDTNTLSSTNKIPFQASTNLSATANPSQTLCQPRNATNKGPFASLPSSFFVPTQNPKNHPPVIAQTYNVPFVAMKEFLKTFDGIDHRSALEKNTSNWCTHEFFSMREQPFSLVAYNQWYGTDGIYAVLSLWICFKLVFVT